MNTIDAHTLAEATISALERTAMVLAEPADPSCPAPPPTRVARIEYSGPRRGALSLGATEGFARELAASLLGVEAAEIDADTQGADALKEMANILAGSVILAMSAETCEYSLGLPQIVPDGRMPAPQESAACAECTVVGESGSLRVVWTQESPAIAA